MSSIFEPFFAQEALDKIAHYLSSRDHSEKELREKLSKKGFTEPEIQGALLKAKYHNWIADPIQLSQKVALSLYGKKKGHHYIQGYLRKKGLPPTSRNETLEVQNAQEIIFQNRKLKNLEPYDWRKKVYQLLSQRGFHKNTIDVILNNPNTINNTLK